MAKYVDPNILLSTNFATLNDKALTQFNLAERPLR